MQGLILTHQMQRPEFLTPCYQLVPAHAGTQDAQRVAVPEGARAKVPAEWW